MIPNLRGDFGLLLSFIEMNWFVLNLSDPPTIEKTKDCFTTGVFYELFYRGVPF